MSDINIKNNPYALRQFTSIQSSYSPIYSRTDCGSGRCRVHASILIELNIPIGHIILLKLTLPNTNDSSIIKHVLCTAWPQQPLQAACKSTIYVDDCVEYLVPPMESFNSPTKYVPQTPVDDVNKSMRGIETKHHPQLWSSAECNVCNCSICIYISCISRYLSISLHLCNVVDTCRICAKASNKFPI